MIETLFNICAIFVVLCSSVLFVVALCFFLFVLFACFYIGWKEIQGNGLIEIWEKITK